MLILASAAEYYLLCPWACRGNILVSNPFSFSQCVSFSQFSLSTFMVKFLGFPGDKNLAFLYYYYFKLEDNCFTMLC